MNTPADHESEDLRYAEYVLGVLDARARASVERDMAADPDAALEVARWQQRLAPLANDVVPAEVPPAVWARVQAQIAASARAPAATPPHRGWWSDLALWRRLALGASAVAAACIIALIVVSRTYQPAPGTAQANYITARIQQDNGVPGWIVLINRQAGNLVVVPAAPNTIAAQHAPELWLIPHGGKPIALGVFTANHATTLPLAPQLLASFNTQALLAVSIEPPGGSPTGQPTGPVVGKGTLGGL